MLLILNSKLRLVLGKCLKFLIELGCIWLPGFIHNLAITLLEIYTPGNILGKNMTFGKKLNEVLDVDYVYPGNRLELRWRIMSKKINVCLF